MWGVGVWVRTCVCGASPQNERRIMQLENHVRRTADFRAQALSQIVYNIVA